jgi:tetratricopeptide (TPR) repeat protein
VRAVAEGIEATLVWRQGDFTVAKELFRRVLPHMPQAQAHAPRLVHSVPSDLGFIAQQEGDQSAAHAYFEEALTAARVAGLRVDEATSLTNLGVHAFSEGDYATAHTRCGEGLALARAVGDPRALGFALWWVGWLSFLQGDIAASHQLLEESVAINRRLGERLDLAQTLDFLAIVAIAKGQFSQAGEAFNESLQLRHEVGIGLAWRNPWKALLAWPRHGSSQRRQSSWPGSRPTFETVAARR